MGVLCDLFAASASEASSLTIEDVPIQRFGGVDAKGLNPVPFSDLIEQQVNDPTDDNYVRFLRGPNTEGQVVSTDKYPVQLGTTDNAGVEMILAFADPFAFRLRYGAQFNAEMQGHAVLEDALLNRSGVLVNSAKAEVSMFIAYKTAKSMLAAGEEKRPWWKFW